MTTDDESAELLLEMIEEADRAHAPARACANCGYSDPIVCAMTCPNCDTLHAEFGRRPE